MLQEKESAGTRTRILDISRELFAAQGYGSTSIAMIAERLGTSKAALYYHFKSKEEILDALLNEPFAAMQDFRDECMKPGAKPEEILGGLIDFVSGPASCLSSFENDPSVLQEWADRNNLKQEWDKLVSSLAGPKPTQTKIIRARAALAAAKQGTMTALELNDGTVTKSARTEILAAALRALG
jgi:AcrR family transcriptional regulator